MLNIIEDVRMLVTNRLNWGARFVYREANNIVHKLAKLAFSIFDEKVWIEHGPIEITNDILKEKHCNDCIVLIFYKSITFYFKKKSIIVNRKHIVQITNFHVSTLIPKNEY